MRILHTEASCGWGGQEIRILSESAGMIERGHQVALACPGHAPIARQAPAHGVEVIALPIEKKRHSPRTFHESRVTIQGVLVEIVRRSFKRKTIGNPH